MAINVSFNGAVIYRPGAYSKVQIDLSGGFPLGPTGLIGIFGEAERGAPGADEPDFANNVYSPDQLTEIRAKYGSGPIVDAAAFLFAPASDAAIPSGAQAVYIYKTNASTRSSLALPSTTGISPAASYGTLRSLEYGIGANKVTWTNTNSTPSNVVTGSVAILAGAVDTALGQTLVISNGLQAPTSHTIAASANRAALISNLNAAFASQGITFAANGSNQLTITRTMSATAHELGYSQVFEIYSTSTSLAALGFTQGVKIPQSEPVASLKIKQLRDLVTEEDSVGGTIVLSVGYSGVYSTDATVTIDADNVLLKVDGSTVATFNKSTFATIQELASEISLVSGWTAAVSDTLSGQQPVSALDNVTAAGAVSQDSSEQSCKIKKDWSEAQEFFAQSQIVEILSQVNCGLPDTQSETLLAGGVKGATTTSAITDALSALQGVRVNGVVPLFSRDATADLADKLTDSGSTYTIDGIHQAVKTHLSLMATTKNRSERQGYLSYKASYADCKNKSANLADPRIQLAIQDVKQIDSQGVLKWFQPHALSCMMAGARGGSPIGTPLTFKYFNVSGIRQTAQSMNTSEASIVNGFNPSTQYEDAIKAGISFLEHPQTGGFRMVVDNTTYGKDGNWVYNRGNVLYAADVLVYDFRNQMENIYVGVKNTVNATEVKGTAESILASYLAQGITVQSDDAKNGYKDLSVSINGNTINIKVTCVLVEGIDFILNEFFLTRKQSTA